MYIDFDIKMGFNQIHSIILYHNYHLLRRHLHVIYHMKLLNTALIFDIFLFILPILSAHRKPPPGTSLRTGWAGARGELACFDNTIVCDLLAAARQPAVGAADGRQPALAI
jgi:hypothetical protein